MCLNDQWKQNVMRAFSCQSPKLSVNKQEIMFVNCKINFCSDFLCMTTIFFEKESSTL